jgi:hypothetical protein
LIAPVISDYPYRLLGRKTQEYQPTFPNSEAHSPQPDESKKSQDIVRKALAAPVNSTTLRVSYLLQLLEDVSGSRATLGPVAGLGPATRVFAARCSNRKKGVDDRDKRGRGGSAVASKSARTTIPGNRTAVPSTRVFLYDRRGISGERR